MTIHLSPDYGVRNSAFNGTAITYERVFAVDGSNSPYRAVENFLIGEREHIRNLVAYEVARKELTTFAIIAVGHVVRYDDNGEVVNSEEVYYRTTKPSQQSSYGRGGEFDEVYERMSEDLRLREEQMNLKGSGWVLLGIIQGHIEFGKMRSIAGRAGKRRSNDQNCEEPVEEPDCAMVPLSVCDGDTMVTMQEYIGRNKHIVPIKSVDNECFYHAVATKILHTETEAIPEEEDVQTFIKTRIKWDTSLPMAVGDISRFEKKNVDLNLAINVLYNGGLEILPCHKSVRLDEPDVRRIDLLLYMVGTETAAMTPVYHFDLISNVHRFVSSLKNEGKRFVCVGCVKRFKTMKSLAAHQSTCNLNGAQGLTVSSHCHNMMACPMTLITSFLLSAARTWYPTSV
jgi:hypothetical protein